VCAGARGRAAGAGWGRGAHEATLEEIETRRPTSALQHLEAVDVALDRALDQGSVTPV